MMNIFKGGPGIIFKGSLLLLYIFLVLLADKSDPFNNFMRITFIIFALITLVMDMYDLKQK